MMQWVIRDYFTAFRIRKIKEAGRLLSLWYLFYFMFFLPLMVADSIRTAEGILFYNLVSFPVIFSIFAATVCPLRLPKMMFLSPLSNKMREEYIVKSCMVRIVIPILLGIVAVMVLLLIGKCDLMCGGIILLNDVIFSFFNGARINTGGFFQENKRTSATSGVKNTLIEVFEIIAAMSLCLIFAMEIASDAIFLMWEKWLFLAVLLGFSLPATVVSFKGWRKSVERAINYESMY